MLWSAAEPNRQVYPKPAVAPTSTGSWRGVSMRISAEKLVSVLTTWTSQNTLRQSDQAVLAFMRTVGASNSTRRLKPATQSGSVFWGSVRAPNRTRGRKFRRPEDDESNEVLPWSHSRSSRMLPLSCRRHGDALGRLGRSAGSGKRGDLQARSQQPLPIRMLPSVLLPGLGPPRPGRHVKAPVHRSRRSRSSLRRGGRELDGAT